MKNPVLILAPVLLVITISCGCIGGFDEIAGVWENKSLPYQEQMSIKSDGTYVSSDPAGEVRSSGTWRKIGGHYEFTDTDSNKTSYGGITPGGRGQYFLIIDNTTYLKL